MSEVPLPQIIPVMGVREVLPDLKRLDMWNVARLAQTAQPPEVSAEFLQEALDNAHLNPHTTGRAIDTGHITVVRHEPTLDPDSTIKIETEIEHVFTPAERRVLTIAQRIAQSGLAWRITMNSQLGANAVVPQGMLLDKLLDDPVFQARRQAANRRPNHRPSFLYQQARILAGAALHVADKPFVR